MMNKESTQEACKIAEELYNKVMLRCSYEDEQDIGEYVAMRLLDAIEWRSHGYEMSRAVANKIIDGYELPRGAKIVLKRYFDLSY